MFVEACRVHGNFCRSAYASLQIPQGTKITYLEKLMSENLKFDTRTSLVPIEKFIDHLHDAMRVLKNCKTHPGDATLIAVSAEQVRDLEVVLVRIDRKQKDWISPGLQKETETEIAERQFAIARLAPIVSKAKDGELCAEELLAALNAENDPRVAKDRFLVMRGDRTTVRDDRQILVPPSSKNLPNKYAAKSSYVVKVQVTSIDKTSADARLILADKGSNAAMFSSADFGIRGITTRVPDPDYLRCLNLCMTYDIPLSVELAISVSIGGTGLGYSATLIRIANQSETMQVLKKAITGDSERLFG
jgi:hypothetical protein